jgi:hypothetical protein
LPPDNAWLAGFYFNSALLRVDAVTGRLQEEPWKKYIHFEKIRPTANKIKHYANGQMHRDWNTVLEDILDALELLCDEIESLLDSPSK